MDLGDEADEETSFSSPLVDKIDQRESVIKVSSAEQPDENLTEEENRPFDLEAEVAEDNEDDDEYVDDEEEEEEWQLPTNSSRTTVMRAKDSSAGKQVQRTSKQSRVSKLERDLRQLSIRDKVLDGTGKSKKTEIISSDSEKEQYNKDDDTEDEMPVVKKKR